jgi:hypothetical protein
MNHLIPYLKNSGMQDGKSIVYRLGITKTQMKRGFAICSEMLESNRLMREQVMSLKAKKTSDSGKSRLSNVRMDRAGLAESSEDRNAIGDQTIAKTVKSGWDLELDVDLT